MESPCYQKCIIRDIQRVLKSRCIHMLCKCFEVLYIMQMQQIPDTAQLLLSQIIVGVIQINSGKNRFLHPMTTFFTLTLL